RAGEGGNLALGLHRDLLGEIATGHVRRDLGDVAHLGREVAGHDVDAVGQVLPGAGDALHLRLTAEPALRADLPGDAGDLVGEGPQLVHHGVDRVVQLHDLALDVHRDLMGEAAA